MIFKYKVIIISNELDPEIPSTFSSIVTVSGKLAVITMYKLLQTRRSTATWSLKMVGGIISENQQGLNVDFSQYKNADKSREWINWQLNLKK